MSIQIASPSSFLSSYIKQYWEIENHVAEGEQYDQRIIPCGLTELMFYFGDRPTASDSNKAIQDISLLSGQHHEYYDLTISGTLSLFSIVFQPHGLMMFFDIPLSKLFNQNVSLKHLINNSTEELESRMFEAGGFSERIYLAERFLLSRLEKSNKLFHFSRIQHSIKIINSTMGNVGIDYLASEACLSRKQYERVFSDFVGSSPKQFLKTVRFQSAVHKKSLSPQMNLTSLAFDSGYYDQSHMIGEFKILAGQTPKQYFAQSEPFSDYFQ